MDSSSAPTFTAFDLLAAQVAFKPTSPVEIPASRENPLRIRYWPDPSLLRPAEEVPEDMIHNGMIVQFIADLLELCEREGLYGIAAPQVGVPLRIFVIDPVKCGVDESNHRVFINPQVSVLDGTVEVANEGCASAPGLVVRVPRHRGVRVEANDLTDSRRFYVDVGGVYGRAIAHEFDHLDGITITRLANRSQRQALKRTTRRLQKSRKR
jgi:peptide deformylase